MGKKKKNIDLDEQRYGMFMNEDSFDLDINYGRHYIKNDVRYQILIHKINLVTTKSHELYGQAKSSDKQFFPPVKIDAMVNVGDVDQSYYGNNEGGIVREDTGDITVSVYLNELDEKNIEVDRGDILEWNQSGDRSRYYEVVKAHNVVDATKQTIAGFKSYWKQIVATPVKEDVVPFLNGDSFK